jgi:hypothetical protein
VDGRTVDPGGEKKLRREEMAQWMLVWLENPEVFRLGGGRKKVKE